MSAALAEAPPLRIAARVAAVVEVAARDADATDRAAAFPDAALSQLRATGLLGLLVPADLGGLGGGVDELIEVAMALGRADMSVAMVFAMHCQQVAAIDRYAAPPLRRRLLPAVARGELYLGSVTTESGTGGHLLSADAELHEADGELRLDRFAPVVTGGSHADGFLVTMRSPYAVGEHEVSLVYAGRDQVQVDVAGRWDPLGMRASDSAPLKLTGSVPADQVIGRHGAFREVATQVFAPMAHLGWSAAWLGTAVGACARVLALLRSRQGRSAFDLGSPLLLHRLSQVRADLDAVHALLRHTAHVVSTTDDLSRPPVQLLLNALKLTASQRCPATVDLLVEAVGMRHGYLRNSPTGLERALRDLRSASLNFHNDRLHQVDGRLTLLDAEVRLA